MGRNCGIHIDKRYLHLRIVTGNTKGFLWAYGYGRILIICCSQDSPDVDVQCLYESSTLEVYGHSRLL